MTIRVRKFEALDYERIARRDFDQLVYMQLGGAGVGECMAKSGPAYTMLAGGAIVACGGIAILWKGVGEAWLIGSPLIQRYKISFGTRAARVLDSMIAEHGLVRVQAVVDAKHSASRKWLLRMGFRPEGRMKRYIAGRTFIRYARVMED